MKTINTIFLALVLTCSITNAGGLIGDIINTVAPGVGTTLDNAHRDIKNAIPPYKAVEEGATHIVNETLVQTTAPLLEQMIIQSRNDALRSGVQSIPPEIRRNLTGFVPENILNIAKYRVQGGGDLSLQVNSLRYGEANAITLDYVIVFNNLNDALYNPVLWAHELKHVEQYNSWGVKDFAIRYVRSFRSVENSAYDFEKRYAAWVVSQNSQQSTNDFSRVNQPISPFSNSQLSSVCGTAVTTCSVNGQAPAGTPCWCSTPLGGVAGSLVPQSSNFSPASNPEFAERKGFPSGTNMQQCGCWGPMVQDTAPENRCASQFVQVSVCPGMCPMGGVPYAYNCR
ncbi:DUF4157 domain-containing protein [Acinetobacter sp. ABJ_C3_5]|uniref:eCIS core domain-containing protein n=1 Tax=Acinetobacter courvalinii TaxID=280147 RepID=UPI0037CBE9DC